VCGWRDWEAVPEREHLLILSDYAGGIERAEFAAGQTEE
jgi:hypothetical protein